MDLALKDYKKILEVIDLIYSIPDRETMFLAACKKLENLIGFSGAVLLPIASETKKFQWPGPLSYNFDPGITLKYTAYYAAIDPLIVSYDGSINNFTQNSEIVSSSLLADSEFGRDFLSPADMLHSIGALLGSQGDAVSGIGFHRQRHSRPFGAREKKTANMILPHIARALHNTDLMDTVVSSLGVGMIIIGDNGHSRYMNEEAKKIMDGRPPSVIPDPGLSASSVVFKANKCSYSVRTIKQGIGRKKTIILLEPLPSEHCIRKKLSTFGLTHCQENTALLAIRGLSNRKIAEKLFISQQTVKDHLHDVFEKLQVRRRSELTAKVMGF
jgi:DNA-binding CsgD family transcriptional regulator